ncbi:cyclic nucleotide-binding domain-containing protein 1 [Nematostella vectensis]|uniref:cyclic nucleotide-binding domain-containing protein 1 n=1 Tax=Nematostella vectensis TaxID=45351 RepID=UPI0020776122|nr:cyclic nucleotide-binding domain-containing protein 1 [Nematostella vectensis]
MTELASRSGVFGGWSEKFSTSKRSQQHKLPKLIGNPALDYDCIKWLCSIDGLGERDRPSTSDAHDIFMQNYPKMFQRPPKLLSLQVPDKRKLDHRQAMSKEIVIPHDKGLYPHQCEGFEEHLCSHNISHHMSKLHKHAFVLTSAASVFNARVHSIRKILRKLPFERKSKENEALFKHLQFFPDLADQVPPHILKELCAVAQMDRWNEAGCTVFGNTGLHLVLRGSVVPQTTPCFSPVSSKQSREFRSPTPVFGDHELRRVPGLSVGDCFGTLDKIEGREANSRILSVLTLEPCEFLKISTNDYARIIQIISSREEEKKLSLAKTCKLFQSWPKLSLKKVAGLIRWRKFPPGQVLVNESERCEIIGFIKRGNCVLKRMITVAHTFPNGKKEKRTKPVVIGRLGPGDSFGETTVLKNRVMPCNVTTESIVEVGTISSLDVYDLDEVTKSLLTQSYFAMDSHMSEEEIQKEYIEQEKAEEWSKFKRKVVNEVLYFRAIQPGYSKWSRKPSQHEVKNF